MKTSRLLLIALMITLATGMAEGTTLIDDLTTAFGGDNTINIAEIAAGQSVSGTSTLADGTPIYVDVAAIQIPTTVAGGTWSVTVDDGTSGTPGAVDVSSLVDGVVSVTVSASPAGPPEDTSSFTLDRLAFFEDDKMRYRINLSLPWTFNVVAQGIEESQEFTLLITDSLNQQFSSPMERETDSGDTTEVWLDFELTGLADGPATYLVSATDTAGNPASLLGNFTIDQTAATTLVLNSPTPGIVSGNSAASLFSFSGTTTSIESGQRVALFLSDAAGGRLHGTTTVDGAGNWALGVDSLTQAPSLTIVNENPAVPDIQSQGLDIAVLTSCGYVATWIDQEFSSGRAVWRRFLPGGTPAGPTEFVREGPGTNESATRVCALVDGGWVIGFLPSSGSEVFYQRYDSTGGKVGGVVTVEPNAGGYLDLAALPDGGWVFVTDAGLGGLDLHRFDHDGVLVAGPTLVAGSQANDPRLAALDGGGWVLVYSLFGGSGDGNDNEIIMEAFSATGLSIAGPIKVDAPDAEEDFLPEVTGLADDGWIVTWMAIGGEADGPDREVLYQRYDALGTPVGGNVQVDGPDTENDGFPVVTGLPDGGWAIVWSEARSADGSAELSYRIYDDTGTARGATAYFGSRWPNLNMDTTFYSAIDAFPDGSFVHFHATFPECRANIMRPFSTSPVGLLDGAVTVEVEIRDQVGNLATASLPIIFDFPTPFRTWTAFSGLTAGVNDGTLDDPNLDGTPNILHFAFDTDPLGSGGDEGKMQSGFIQLPTGRHFALTLPVRKGAVFAGVPNPCATIDGIVYSIQGSGDLQAWTQSVSEFPAAPGLPPLRDIDSNGTPDWEYRAFILDDPNLIRGFLRTVVETAP